MIALNLMNEGTCAKIVKIEAGKGLSRQLKNMGLLEGEIVRVIQNKQGPLIIGRGDLRFALGRGMSFKIFVERLKEAQCPIK